MARKFGPLLEPTRLSPGDHICWTYTSTSEHLDTLVDYVADGVACGDRVTYLGTDGSERRLPARLRAHGLDVDTLLSRGQLILGSAERAYMPDGYFDPDARLASYEGLVEDAVRCGYRAYRVAAEAGWLLGDPRTRERWPSYELRADLLATQIPFIAMCCYDGRASHPAGLAASAAVHPSTLDKNSFDSPMFRLHGADDGGIALGGELDVTNVNEARPLLATAARHLASPIVDLSGLRFVDVSGVQAIADLVRAASARYDGIRMRGASTTFAKVWRLLGVQPHLSAVFV